MKKQLLFILLINSLLSIFEPKIDLNHLRDELKNQRKLTSSELINWMYAVHYHHTATAEEKKSNMDQLKQQVTQAKEQNEKIGGFIKNA